MRDWYAKYIDRDFIEEIGHVEGSESWYYRKYIYRGHVERLGLMRKRGGYKFREVQNSSFRQFCERKGYPIFSDYRMVNANHPASFKSISKYDRVEPVVQDDAWELAGEWTKEHFAPSMSGSRVMEQDEVVKEMDHNTSTGTPWNFVYQRKKEFFADPVMSAVLPDYWMLIGSEITDKVPIWTCSQKIELRSLQKLQDNAVRTFTASPVEHSCALNRVCLDMNNKFYDAGARQVIWSFVGATKFLCGWDRLYRRLSVHPNAFELDEKDFDASLFARALYGQMEIRWSFLREEDRTPENRLRLENLYHAIVNSVIVLETGELMQKFLGNPSGSSNTIVDNTMILYRLFAYAWIVLCKERGVKPNRQEFEREVEAALNGDDNTFTVSDVVVSWFNPVSIKRVWDGIGVTTKTPCETPRPLSETTFLSQGFKYDDGLGLWMPRPDHAKVLSSLMWGSPNDDVRWHLLRACALRLDSYGNEYARKVLAEYIDFLNSEFKDRLVGEVRVSQDSDPVTMSQIRSIWKSDMWIEALYAGKESGGLAEVERMGELIKRSPCKETILEFDFLREIKQSLIIMPKRKQSGAERPPGQGQSKRARRRRRAREGIATVQLGSAAAKRLQELERAQRLVRKMPNLPQRQGRRGGRQGSAASNRAAMSSGSADSTAFVNAGLKPTVAATGRRPTKVSADMRDVASMQKRTDVVARGLVACMNEPTRVPYGLGSGNRRCGKILMSRAVHCSPLKVTSSTDYIQSIRLFPTNATNSVCILSTPPTNFGDPFTSAMYSTFDFVQRTALNDAASRARILSCVLEYEITQPSTTKPPNVSVYGKNIGKNTVAGYLAQYSADGLYQGYYGNRVEGGVSVTTGRLAATLVESSTAMLMQVGIANGTTVDSAWTIPTLDIFWPNMPADVIPGASIRIQAYSWLEWEADDSASSFFVLDDAFQGDTAEVDGTEVAGIVQELQHGAKGMTSLMTGVIAKFGMELSSLVVPSARAAFAAARALVSNKEDEPKNDPNQQVGTDTLSNANDDKLQWVADHWGDPSAVPPWLDGGAKSSSSSFFADHEKYARGSHRLEHDADDDVDSSSASVSAKSPKVHEEASLAAYAAKSRELQAAFDKQTAMMANIRDGGTMTVVEKGRTIYTAGVAGAKQQL